MEHIFTRENRQYVSRRLQTRTVLYLIIAIALFLFMLYDIAIGQASWWMSIGGFIIGTGIGFAYGRLLRLKWHETEDTLVRQNDIIGFLLILGYIALGYARDALLRDVLSGAALIAVSLAVGSGVLLGRFFGMHVTMMRMIKERADGTTEQSGT